MNYLNIHTDTLRSERFISAEPVQRSTWLCLSAWCATQENGGRINQCEEWGDRRWMQLAGVTKAEVHDETSPLFNFVDGDLIIHLYPVEKEQEYQRKVASERESAWVRRAMRMKAARRKGTHTPEEWKDILWQFDFKCAKCGSPENIQKDHIVPVSKGGSDAASNLQPLCRTCNVRKGTSIEDYRDGH